MITLTGVRGWLFEPSSDKPSVREIFRWWEARRFAYNVIVGIAGIVSLTVFAVVMAAPGMLTPGEDAFEPMAILFLPIPINIAYTLGSAVETAWRRWAKRGSRRTGPYLLAIGLGFSLLMMLTPLMLAMMFLASHFGKSF